MVERVGITEADLRRLMDLVDPARCGEDGEYLPYSVMADLGGILGCDEVNVQVMDPYRHDLGELQTATGLDLEVNSRTEALAKTSRYLADPPAPTSRAASRGFHGTERSAAT